jgi:ATP/ADP translocase
MVVEHPGVFSALGRSRELVRGYGWQVFGTIVLIALIEIAVYIVFGLIGIAFSDAVRAVLNWIAATLTAPIVALTSSVLYFALLAAKEHVAPAAGPAAPSPFGETQPGI